MNGRRRWMKWIFEEVETFDTPMPWSRSARTGAWKRHLSKASLRLVSRA